MMNLYVQGGTNLDVFIENLLSPLVCQSLGFPHLTDLFLLLFHPFPFWF